MSNVETPTTTTTLITNSNKNNYNNVCDKVTGTPTQKWLQLASTEQVSNMSDKDAVKDFISRSLESLPAPIQSTAIKICNRFHSLWKQVRNKQQTLKCYNNAE